MAELTALSYYHRESLLHKLDVRFKLIFLILISFAVLKADFMALSLLSFMLLIIIAYIRLPVKSTIKALRYFIILIFLVFLARAFSTPGSVLINLKVMSITREGIYDGAVVCWRLFMVVILGLLFASTTRPSEVKAAVQWFLIPFRFMPGKRIAIMMSLIMRFIPVIIDQVKETVDAQRARGIENRKNPVYRLIKLLIPVIRRTFESADDLAVAMEARCYSENRTDPSLASERKDWIALFVVICLCAVIVKL